jgi:hypothetical protein
MTIFAVLLPDGTTSALEDLIPQAYPNNFLKVGQKQFLISTIGTAVDVSAKLGIYDPKEPNKPSAGNAIVFATSSYFGRAPTTVWDWVKAKLENPSG